MKESLVKQETVQTKAASRKSSKMDKRQMELDEMKKSTRKELEDFEKLTSQDLTSLKSKVAQTSAPRHVESGKEVCGASKDWSKSNVLYLDYGNVSQSASLHTMTIKFKQLTVVRMTE